MNLSTASVVRQDEAREFYEGPELCREYFHNEQMWFGTSVVEPGDIGGLDPGHDGSFEVFYCVSGEKAIVDDGTKEHQIRPGDILVIPPNVPHTVHNRGKDQVIIAWAGAPGAPAA